MMFRAASALSPARRRPLLALLLALPLLIAWGCVAEDDLTFDQRA